MRRGLEPLVAGAVVDHVEVFRDSCVRRQPGGPGEFAMSLTGARLTGAVRRGKFLWMPLEPEGAPDDGAARALSAHLGMSGQFRVPEAHGAAPHPHCRARLRLSGPQGPVTLDFLDQRTFGYLTVEKLVATEDGLPGGHGSDIRAVPTSVAHIARDALDPGVDVAVMARAIRASSRSIKQVLLDQGVVSGIGNIYADEALWLARIHPAAQARSLTHDAAEALVLAAREVMTRALAEGGTSFDALYVAVNGESGYFSRSLEAYGRHGQPCGRCGGLLVRGRLGGRSTHWCDTCQGTSRTGTTQD